MRVPKEDIVTLRRTGFAGSVLFVSSLVLFFASENANADCAKCWDLRIGSLGYHTPFCRPVDVYEAGNTDCATFWKGDNRIPSCELVGEACTGKGGVMYAPYWWCKILGCPIGGPGVGGAGMDSVGCHFIAFDGTCWF